MTGSRLGHYEILEKLGEGGMGMVFKARDVNLDRFAAIKILPPDKLKNSDRKQRFIREAKAASALNHPNIVTIYEIGDHDGADYIAMEYVAGRTLDQLIAAGPMRLGDILRIAVPIADALARAHTANIVHRDVKPGNIIAGDDGQVKLLDFGLAKLTEDAPPSESDATRTAQNMTEEGTVLGTVAYMSPEQAEGRKVDPRSDIFSLGTVLYEMATGQRPFQGSSKLSIMAAILHAEPRPPREIAATTPADLDRIIQRCLRKDPAWRYQSAADLKVSLAELERSPFAATSSSQPAIPSKPQRRVPTWLVPLAAGLLLGLAPAWWLSRGADSTLPEAYNVRPLTAYSGTEQEPALSPDGNQVAFVWDGEHRDNTDIYVRLVDGGAPLRLTSDRLPERSPAWSPDGRRIAFRRGASILVVPALGGNERLILKLTGDTSSVNAISWSADGRHIAFAANPTASASSIQIVDVESGESRQISTPPATPYGDHCPAFSPDGRFLAFIRRLDFGSSSLVLQSMNADASPSGQSREIFGPSQQIGHIVWSNDSQSLIASSNPASRVALVRITLDGRLRPLGIESGNARWPSLSRTGNRLAYQKVESDANIWLLDGPGPDGGPQPYRKTNPRLVVDSTAFDSTPMLSADATRLAFTSTRSGSLEIYTANADGSNQEAATAMGPRSLGSPRWSPDGQHIVFDRYENGRNFIYVVRAQGGKARKVVDQPSTNTRPSWSHDGKWIYFASTVTGRQEIWKVQWNGTAEPGPPVQVTTTGGEEPFESPDAKELLFITPQGVSAIPISGGPPTLLVPGARAGHWAMAGRSIYYFPKPQSLWILRRDSGRQFEYVLFPAEASLNVGGTAFTVSPDERRIYFHRQDRLSSDLMLVDNFR